METKVVFFEKDRSLKNVRLKIVEYLIAQGVFPESIKFSTQELHFKQRPEQNKPDEQWCDELSAMFRGRVEFREKFPDQYPAGR
ncbi:MAG: hypothetical protein HUJ25_09970 [Crocinitomicaceae bacterium]|nr:hypothetical protein [Crocinitomicaceae bacterium]